MPKPSNKILVVIGLLLFCYVNIGVLIIYFSARSITDEYFHLQGSKALDIAVVTANKLAITDSQFRELKLLPYQRLAEAPANRLLAELFENRGEGSDIKYVYILSQLEPEEVKYWVDETNSVFYDLPEGTPLDVVWLLDVVLGAAERKKMLETPDYFDDINRYSAMRSIADISLYKNRSPGYSTIKDEWGEYVSGLVPFYTVEGTFAGLLGVDIYAENLSIYRKKILYISLLLFIIPSIILGLVLLIVYANYVKVYRQSSVTDELSKLYNRTYLQQIFPVLLRSCVRNRLPLTVIMIDIDFFKKYNDWYGHQSGDEVIEKIGKVLLQSLLRSSDVAVRYGGEEFILLLQGVDSVGAAMVGERIRKGIMDLQISHDASSESVVTVSLGIYTAIPENADEKCMKEFIQKADEVLYKAKRSGRNCCKLSE